MTSLTATLTARPGGGTSVSVAVSPAKRRAVGARTNFAAVLIAIAGFLTVAVILLHGGYVSPDVDAMLNRGAGLNSGGWLTETVLFVLRAMPADWARVTAIAVLPAGAAGLLFGVLYHTYRDSDWSAGGAALLLALLGSHALILYAVTSAGLVLPTLIALGCLIPAIRRLESVGDVQADVSFGLVLPLLLLAGPATTLLIPPLAVLSALLHPDGRGDRRAFLAMLLVALIPTLIVIVAVFGFGITAGIDPADLLLPYARAFASLHFDGLAAGLIDVARLAPVAVIPVVYCFFADRRRRRWSALAVVGLPLYLAIGNAVFPWALPSWLPAAAVMVCFATWLAVARVRLPFRAAALVLLAVSVIGSWSLSGVLDDAAWIEALTGGW